MSSRTVARFGAPAVTLGIVLALAGPASAHVTVSASETGAGAYTLLTFSVPHGCDGSPTTKIAIQLPDSVVEATPTRNPFYDVSKVSEKLDTPLVAEDGDEITERTSQIVYTATTPLPDGERDAFEVSLQLPEDAEGQQLAFPVLQSCAKGQTAWTEVAADGEDAHELEHPAPVVEVTAATGEDHHGEAAAEPEPSEETAAATHEHDAESAEASSDDEGSDGLAIAGLIAGVLGLLAGGAALLSARRKA